MTAKLKQEVLDDLAGCFVSSGGFRSTQRRTVKKYLKLVVFVIVAVAHWTCCCSRIELRRVPTPRHQHKRKLHSFLWHGNNQCHRIPYM